jgi:universal stress protein A
VAEAEGYLAEKERRLADRGIRVSSVVRYGPPAEEILDHARTSGIDLIAMSTHGRSGLERVLLGSVAERVLRESPVPVLLRRAVGPVPAGTGDEVRATRAPIRPQGAAPGPQVIRHILCPVDFSRTSDAALEQAGMLAQRFGADLTVLHVVYDPLDATCLHVPHPPQEQLREEMIREAERGLQTLLRRRLRDLPRAKTAVVVGPPFREIVRYAEQREVDLIVMGTQGLSGLGHLIIGSTAERVVRTAPCPVLSIRAAV